MTFPGFAGIPVFESFLPERLSCYLLENVRIRKMSKGNFLIDW